MKSLYVLKAASAIAVALFCIPIALAATTDKASPTVTATLPSIDDSAISAKLRADPLLSVDMNRGEIVSRLMTQWQGELAAPQRENFKDKLSGLRADRLLAVSLVGTFVGVLEVLDGQEKSDRALATLSALGSRDGRKALGDPDKDLLYTPLSPCRLFDTRPYSSALGQLGGTFAANTRRAIVPAGACAIPGSGVKSLVISATTLNNTINSGGFLAMLAPAAPVTTVVDIFNIGSSWSGSNTIVATGAAGQFDVYVSGANAEVVVDVLGYFAPPSSTGDGLRILQSGVASAPNVINGSTANEVLAGVRGATIAGGGITDGTDPFYGAAKRNRVTDIYGTVGGGWGNRAGDDASAANSAVGATVAGGLGNTAGGGGSAVAGGSANASNGLHSAIGGGLNNTSSASFSKIGGGELNFATGQHSSVGGGRSNQATGPFSVVVGGGGNNASAHGSFIGGGGYCCFGVDTTSFPNTVTGRGGAIVGGYENSVAGAASFVGGGYINSITGTELTTYGAAVVGGVGNTVSASYASVGGGISNVASASNTVVAGGASNTASAAYASVPGGLAGSARLFGQTANAAGSFSTTVGTAQATQYVLRNRTTDATQTPLFLDGVSALISFEPGRAGVMDIQVVAFREGTGFTAGYTFKCVYTVVTGGGSIQPFGCFKTVVNEADPSWDVNIAFAPSSSNLGILVIGAAGNNIRWVATVRATEVSTQ